MKKLFYVLCVLMLSFPLMAQDDLESMTFDDIELEGYENVWIQTQLMPLSTADFGTSYQKLAKPIGGTTNFMGYVQKYWIRLLQVVIDKYPAEMLNRQGRNFVILIDFDVDAQGGVQVHSVYGGSLFGFDSIIAQKMFNDYKKWRPALLNRQNVSMRYVMKIDLSL